MQQESQELECEEALIDVTGGRLHYLHAGSGAPMFLIHGLIGSSENWRSNINALAQNASVYAIDMLNMGKSERVDGLDASLSATATRIIAAMNALGLEAADIVAHSYGGAIALMLAALHPTRVRRLILFAPANPYSHASDLIVRIYSSAWGRYVARMLPYLPALIQRLALGQRNSDPDRIVDSCLRQIIADLRCPGTLPHVLSIVHCWFGEMARLKTVLRRIGRTPTLLVWGNHDCTVSLDSAVRLHRKLHASELVILPGGHSVFEESPAESNRIMLDWLGRHSLRAAPPMTASGMSASSRDRIRCTKTKAFPQRANPDIKAQSRPAA